MSPGILLRELWQVWRTSLRRPGFVLLAGLTLALGVGFSTAFVNLMRRLDQPINAAQPQKLFLLSPVPALPGAVYSPIKERDYRILRTLPGLVSIGVISTASGDVNFSAGGQPVLASEVRASRGYLTTLGIRMAQGRYFSATEDQPHGPPAVILTHGFWQRHFAGQHVVGRSVQINGQRIPVIGVLTANFQALGPSVDLLLPLQLDAAKSDTNNLVPLVRLRSGTDPTQLAALATARVRAMLLQHGGQQPMHFVYRTVPIAKLNGSLDIGPLMELALAGLLLVLVSNLVNLMLVRAQQTRQSLALRAALGAPLPRLLLGALGEGWLVVLVGVTAGTMVAHLVSTQLTNLLNNVVGASGSPVTATTWTSELLIAIPLTLLVVLLSATAANWRVRHADRTLQTLHSANAGIARGASRSSRLLLIVQTTLAVALVGIGLLFATAAYRASALQHGYDTHDVYQFHLALPKSLYPNVTEQIRLMHAVSGRLRALPGAESAGASNGAWFNTTFENSATLADGHKINVDSRAFSGDYAQTLRVPMRQGRSPRGAGRSGLPLLWVNTAFVHRYLHGMPLGQSIVMGSGKTKIEFRIAGVVGNTFSDSSSSEPLLWLPITPATVRVAGTFADSSPYFIVRMRPGRVPSAASIAAAVHAEAPLLAVAHLRPLADDAPGSVSMLTLLSKIVLLLALATLMLAAVGLFAITRVTTGARTREFGVRLAMGASPMQLLRLVLRGALLRTLIGLLLGSGLAVLLGLLARNLLLQLGASWIQPWSLMLTWLVLLAVGLLAALPPALRAARTPPGVVLGDD